LNFVQKQLKLIVNLLLGVFFSKDYFIIIIIPKYKSISFLINQILPLQIYIFE
jgi:hypothetical protein